MNAKDLHILLTALAAGNTSVDEAMERLRRLPFADLGFAKVDHHRRLRTGFPEVVLAEGKAPEHLIAILEELRRAGGNILGTRVSPQQAELVQTAIPSSKYLALPRLVVIEQEPRTRNGQGQVLVVSAGTSDIPIAEEAAVTAELCGSQVERLYDVGVAGLHRLLAAEGKLRGAAIVIVVAGMEGALPSVVAGLSGRPVIAVPTSVGYGVGAKGVVALLGMLTSCAAGVTVVNIDNGFGAGYAAALLNRSPPQMGEQECQ